MRNLHHLENSVLIDMLAEYTLKFTHLFRIYRGIHTSREYRNCKKKIERIITELEERGLIPKKMSSFSKGQKEKKASLLPK